MARRVFRAKKTAGALKAGGFIAVVTACVILIYIGIGNLNATQAEKQAEIAQDAIIKAAVQCYALESRFPPSLGYLVDNYGITLDEDRYVYHYRAIGSNMMPEIKIFPKNASGGAG